MSQKPVAAATLASVQADVVRINQQRAWWCEPLRFANNAEELSGCTKLFLPGYTTEEGGYVEVDPSDDCFMAVRDARFILEQLAHWSAAHGINWALAFEEGEIGTITGGEIDAELQQMIRELSLMNMEDPVLEEGDEQPGDNEARADMIDQKYASRR